MNKSLKDKIALVTGGTRGIGKAIAIRLAAEGAKVAITYRSSETEAQKVISEIEEIGGEVIALKADAREQGSSAKAVKDTIEKFGAIDILVSNAGINIIKPLGELKDTDYEAVFEVNVQASLEVIREASRYMKAGGRIVVISATIANSFFAPGLGLYGASKAALNAFVQGWSRDLGPKGITINAVVPGPINTDMNPEESDLAQHLKQQVPLGRYGTADEVAALTNFLVSSEAGFITGSRMIIDGGMSV